MEQFTFLEQAYHTQNVTKLEIDRHDITLFFDDGRKVTIPRELYRRLDIPTGINHVPLVLPLERGCHV